ncbi:phage tail protein [Cellulomonas aerilata]|uniref:Phage tail protein n=1 Tax=Cellulomonas aerilata TaxID=515326 RepID=A0A512D9Y9_9CELL|nr:phage tail protein [Cellulomonas aerilata]GEO33289.1 phage tail protein [Cellulomonas aerilata]
MARPEDVDTAVSVRYRVSLDGAELGAFDTCDGLGCEVVVETREEGGRNDSVVQMFTRLKYPNIKLSRPLGRDTEQVARLFAAMVNGYTLSGGTIVAMRADGKEIARWSLRDVLPIRWTGPSFNPDQPKVLTETVEIAHHGFTAEQVRV